MSHPDECLNEKRLNSVEESVTRHDEQLKTVFKDKERLESSVEALTLTTQTLSLLCSELKTTITVLKWVCVTMISATGLIFIILEFALRL